MPSDTLPPGGGLRTLRVVVDEVVVETRDTVTLVFDRPGAYEYRSGQYLTIDPHQFSSLARFVEHLELLKKRKEPPRAYSMASAPHERLAITIKEEIWTPRHDKYPTLLSPFLVHDVREGTPMTIAGFTGPYHLPDGLESRTEHVVHLCAGSGSVPNWSIVKAALTNHAWLRHTWIYSNTRWDDVIYRDALHALALRHADRLRVIHTLTEQTDLTGLPAGVRAGPLSAEFVREVIPDYDRAMFYACGPALTPWARLAAKENGVEPAPRFIEQVRAIMTALRVPRARFKEESFG